MYPKISFIIVVIIVKNIVFKTFLKKALFRICGKILLSGTHPSSKDPLGTRPKGLLDLKVIKMLLQVYEFYYCTIVIVLKKRLREPDKIWNRQISIRTPALI